MHEFPGFQVDRELGRGAMAVVYLATQLSLKRPVALKVLDRNVDGYADMAQRFIHEAHTLAGLRHRNIVTVYDVVESPQGEFISMEYLDDGSLSDRLAVGLGVQQSLAILAQLGSALDAAHAMGVVHRDIKPDNVLFRDSDTPVLADFGIARELASDSQRMTQAGLVLGTPSYMAPEQIAGDPVDGRTDQYSLGAMFFQMLTGRVPYTADTTTNLLYAHMARPIPQLPEALAVLQPVLNRMLAKTPDERYPDMAAMLLDVSRHLLRAPELLRASPGAPQVSPTERLHQLGFLTTGLHSVLPADATQVMRSTSAPGAAKTPLAQQRRRNVFRVAAVAMVVVALGLLGFVFRANFQGQATPAVAAGTTGLSEKSIAVLPFVNMSADKDQEYFADGISEELLNQLAKIPELRVIARSSSFAFKGKDIGVAEIARQLNVAHILEGSIRKSGNKIRITAELIRTSDSSHLWSETYDRPLDDIFAVQDEISTAVVGQLKLKLLGTAPKARAVDPRAYALFLQARQLTRQRTAVGFTQAIALYQQALAIDPGYAEAWSGLSRVYNSQVGDGLRPIAEGSALSREAVNKALALDPDLASAHANLGRLAMVFDGDMVAAAQRYTRALSLAPDDVEVLAGAATLAMNLGRVDSAIELSSALVARDPVVAAAHQGLGLAYLYAGRADAAIASERSALALSPGFITAHYMIGLALLQKGQPQAALAEMRLESVEGGWGQIGLPMVWHALGNEAKADAAMAELIRDQAKDSAFNIAYVYAFRGDADKAFEWLDKAIANKDPGMSQLVPQPEFANIRKDPRWLPLLHKLGQAPEQLAAIKFDVALGDAKAAP